MDKSYPLISIIIPTLNNEKDLFDCLESIKNVDCVPKQLEVLIWDNGSKSECKETIKQYLSKLKEEYDIQNVLIESEENLGVYTTRDELLKRVNPNVKFILSIDDDVILPSQILNNMLPFFEQKSSLGIIGPRTVFDDFPSKTAHGAGFINWWLGRYSDLDAEEVIECDYVIGCCMLIKKEVIDLVGGFDRDYYTSHGEIDFCLKAKEKGFKTLYQPNVIVRHRVEKEGTQTLERTYYIFRNKLFVIKKNASLLQKITSLLLYSLFWPPKILIDSIIKNKGINIKEIKIILKAVSDGITGKVGKQDING
jgi:GT2 family glycosyltransferase